MRGESRLRRVARGNHFLLVCDINIRCWFLLLVECRMGVMMYVQSMCEDKDKDKKAEIGRAHV